MAWNQDFVQTDNSAVEKRGYSQERQSQLGSQSLNPSRDGGEEGDVGDSDEEPLMDLGV